MPQVSVDAFDREGLALVCESAVAPGIVDQRVVGGEVITVVLVSLWGAIQKSLYHLGSALFDHSPADNTARRPVDNGHEVPFVFLSPMNVYSSSISATSSSPSGSGADGSCAAYARTQFPTLW